MSEKYACGNRSVKFTPSQTSQRLLRQQAYQSLFQIYHELPVSAECHIVARSAHRKQTHSTASICHETDRVAVNDFRCWYRNVKVSFYVGLHVHTVILGLYFVCVYAKSFCVGFQRNFNIVQFHFFAQLPPVLFRLLWQSSCNFRVVCDVNAPVTFSLQC